MNFPTPSEHGETCDLVEVGRLERQAFAAKIRMARAAIGWSQTELAMRVGLTQRSVHKLEQGCTDPRRATVRAIEWLWHEQGIEFEELPDGGFRIAIHANLLDAPVAVPLSRHRRATGHNLGETAHTHRT